MLRNSNKFYFNPGSEKKPPVFEISEADKPFLDAEIEKHAEELAAQDIRNAKNPNWDEFGHYKHVNLTRLIEEKRFKCHMDEINEKLAGKKESLKVQPIAYQQFIESIAGMSFFDKKINWKKW